MLKIIQDKKWDYSYFTILENWKDETKKYAKFLNLATYKWKIAILEKIPQYWENMKLKDGIIVDWLEIIKIY